MQTETHSDEVKAALAKAREQIVWIRENLVGIELKGDHRHRIPAQLFDLAIEQKPGFDSKFLSNVKDSAMNAMHGYMHGGIHQVSRRLDGDYIEPCFEDNALLEVIQFSATMALIAFGQIAALADREDLVTAADALMTGKPADAAA